MKKYAKSQPEPTCLASVRRVIPGATWDQLRNGQPSCYTAIRDKLRSDQRQICAYCEIELDASNEQVAHCHPKSDTGTVHNWALDWDNLWLACKGGSQTWMQSADHYCPPLPENLSCDERKGSAVLDGLVLTPGDVPAFPRIFRFEQFPDSVEIRPDDAACGSAGIPVDKVQRTIDEFGLNCPRLARARLAMHRQLEQALKKLRNAGNIDTGNALLLLVQRHMGRTPEGNWRRFFTLVRWRLGQVVEKYLQSINFNG